MKSTAVRAICLDASALAKLYVDEDGSRKLRLFIQNEPTYYTTPFCFYETLSILKVKWLYRKEITHDEYLKKTFELSAWFSVVSRKVRDLDFLSYSIINEVKILADKHKLDLSDAFQILSVKKGYFSGLVGGSKTIFVTADKGLAHAAKNEGIRTWHVLSEPEP